MERDQIIIDVADTAPLNKAEVQEYLGGCIPESALRYEQEGEIKVIFKGGFSVTYTGQAIAIRPENFPFNFIAWDKLKDNMNLPKDAIIQIVPDHATPQNDTE